MMCVDVDASLPAGEHFDGCASTYLQSTDLSQSITRKIIS